MKGNYHIVAIAFTSDERTLKFFQGCPDFMGC